MQVRVSASAEADIREASEWYEARQEGLGEQFLGRVREAAGRIAQNPAGYAKRIGEARKVNLQQFPYALYFTVKNHVLIVACLHARRSPQVAKERAAGINPLKPREP